MNAKGFETIIIRLNNQGKMNFLEKATEKQIEEFERNNSIKLPIKYKEWLTYSDGGEFFLPAGVQMYGVAHKPTINVNYNDRPNDNYIIIGALSSGDPILCGKLGEQIYIYDHEANLIHDDEVYPDFISFLNNLHDILGIGE